MLSSAHAGCPFLGSHAGSGSRELKAEKVPQGTVSISKLLGASFTEQRVPFDKAAFDSVDFDAVRKDIRALLTDSKAFWPADFGNYGGLMIRLAWVSLW